MTFEEALAVYPDIPIDGGYPDEVDCLNGVVAITSAIDGYGEPILQIMPEKDFIEWMRRAKEYQEKLNKEGFDCSSWEAITECDNPL